MYRTRGWAKRRKTRIPDSLITFMRGRKRQHATAAADAPKARRRHHLKLSTPRPYSPPPPSASSPSSSSSPSLMDPAPKKHKRRTHSATPPLRSTSLASSSGSSAASEEKEAAAAATANAQHEHAPDTTARDEVLLQSAVAAAAEAAVQVATRISQDAVRSLMSKQPQQPLSRPQAHGPRRFYGPVTNVPPPQPSQPSQPPQPPQPQLQAAFAPAPRPVPTVAATAQHAAVPAARPPALLAPVPRVLMPATVPPTARFSEAPYGCEWDTDSHICFDEGPHLYYTDWDRNGKFFCELGLSTTGFVGAFFSSFNAQLVLGRMFKVQRDSLGREIEQPCAKYPGMTRAQVEEMWRQNGVNASAAGTRGHAMIESFLKCRKDLPSLIDENPVLDQFRILIQRLLLELVPYRMEVFLFSNFRTQITGAADGTFIHLKRMAQRTAEEIAARILFLALWDWKFSKEIKEQSFNGHTMGEWPLHRLQDCNASKYYMQQNVYKYLMENFVHEVKWRGETYTQIRVVSMHLGVFHDNHTDGQPKVYEVPELRWEVEELFKLRERDLAAQRAGTQRMYPFDRVNGLRTAPTAPKLTPAARQAKFASFYP